MDPEGAGNANRFDGVQAEQTRIRTSRKRISVDQFQLNQNRRTSTTCRATRSGSTGWMTRAMRGRSNGNEGCETEDGNHEDGVGNIEYNGKGCDKMTDDKFFGGQ